MSTGKRKRKPEDNPPSNPPGSLLRRLEKSPPSNEPHPNPVKYKPVTPDQLQELRRLVCYRLSERFGAPDDVDLSSPDALRARLEKASTETAEDIFARDNIRLAKHEYRRFISQCVNEWLGTQPIQDLFDDDQISEIYVYDPDTIYAVRKGRFGPVEARFDDQAQLLRCIRYFLGFRLDESRPIAKVRRQDGPVVTAAIPPLAVKGPTLTLYKYLPTATTARDLVRLGMISTKAAEFLRACVFAGLRILVSGEHPSSITWVMTVLAEFAGPQSRIVVMEREPELSPFLSRPLIQCFAYGNVEMPYTVEDLPHTIRWFNPDLLIFGELYGPEAMTALQLQHQILASIRAWSPEAALRSFEEMALLSRHGDPSKARAKLANHFKIVVQMDKRGVTGICEVQGIEDGEIKLVDLFNYAETADANGRPRHELLPTGNRPSDSLRYAFSDIADALTKEGIDIQDSLTPPV